MEKYSIHVESRGMDRFLAVRQSQDMILNDYQLKMLELNSIPGLLPLRSRTVDGNTELYYELKNRWRLVDLIQKGHIDSKKTRILCKKLVDSFIGMKEYSLNVNRCIYNIEYLYVDEPVNPFLPYLPFEGIGELEINGVWNQFFTSIVKPLIKREKNSFYDELEDYLFQQNFDLEEFRKIVSKQGPDTPPVPPVLPPLPSDPPPVYTSPEKKKNPRILGKIFNKKEKGGKPENSKLCIPGHPSQKIEQMSAEEEDVKAKKLGGTTSSDVGGCIGGSVFIDFPEKGHIGTAMAVVGPCLRHGSALIPIGHLPFTIGREENADYIVANPTVSGIHATIRMQETGGYCVEDENSHNGTWVDGEQLVSGQKKQLRDGASLRLSTEDFTFHER